MREYFHRYCMTRTKTGLRRDSAGASIVKFSDNYVHH
jgi:hypothetical protein